MAKLITSYRTQYQGRPATVHVCPLDRDVDGLRVTVTEFHEEDRALLRLHRGNPINGPAYVVLREAEIAKADFTLGSIIDFVR